MTDENRIVNNYESTQCSLCLVDMPFGITWVPSFGLSILKAEAEKSGISTKVLYGSMRFARKLGEDFSFLDFLARRHPILIEAVFAPWAGYRGLHDEETRFSLIKENLPEIRDDIEKMERICIRNREKIDDFLDELAEEILSFSPRLVGCSYTFQQCNASLALLYRIKEKAPDVITFMGGGALSRSCAQTLLEQMPFLNYAFLGDSDSFFGDACRLLMEGRDQELFERYEGIGKKGTDIQPAATQDMNSVALPDYDDFFEELERNQIRFGPGNHYLLMEAGRGCWWGRCRFCGLHVCENKVRYRHKDNKVFASQIRTLNEKYGVNRFFLTDTILHPRLISEIPSLFEGSGLEFVAEVKSNLTREQLFILKRGGFILLQPGIESLQDDILELMQKGASAMEQIIFLRNIAIVGIQAYWNLMIGHPGEKKEWYEEMAERIRKLTHLKPPYQTTLMYQRESEYTKKCREFGVSLKSSPLYEGLVSPDTEFIEGIAEYFVPDPPIDPEIRQMTDKVYEEWKKASERNASFVYRQLGKNTIALLDTRSCAYRERDILQGLEAELCLFLDRVSDEEGIFGNFAGRYEKREIQNALEKLEQRSILLRIKNEYLFLALPEKNPRLSFNSLQMQNFKANAGKYIK